MPAISKADSAIVITSVPYTISSPGQYILKSDLKLSHAGTSGATAIGVQANNVRIDLAGYTLWDQGPIQTQIFTAGKVIGEEGQWGLFL